KQVASRGAETANAKLGCVVDNSHRGIASVDADHAASGMRASSAQVEARHGRARRKPLGPHVRRQALTLENVAARQSDLHLDIGRTKHLRVDHRTFDIRTESRKGIECEPANFFP